MAAEEELYTFKARGGWPGTPAPRPGPRDRVLLWTLRFMSNKISGFRARPMYSKPLNRDLEDESDDSPAGPSFLNFYQASGGQFSAQA